MGRISKVDKRAKTNQERVEDRGWRHDHSQEKKMNKKPLVAILGCGPSGLFAAWACETHGIPFVIFSRYKKSDLGGAQFSHIPIPGITEDRPPVELQYKVFGEASIYREKVYGSDPVPFVSFENVYDGMTVTAWNLRAIYDHLWERYAANIIQQPEINGEWVERIEDSVFDVVFSSIPGTAICRASYDMNVSHSFKSHPIRIYNQALADIPDNTIVYDGTKDHSYYRMSKIFGIGSTEWGGSSAIPPGIQLRTVHKPIATNCDCHPKIQRIGRFGTWTKGVLTMHAYNKVIDTLAVMGVDL